MDGISRKEAAKPVAATFTNVLREVLLIGPRTKKQIGHVSFLSESTALHPWRSRFLPLLRRETSSVKLNLGGDAVQDEVESTLKTLIIGNFRGHLDKKRHIGIISGRENCFRENWLIHPRPPSFPLASVRSRTLGSNKTIHNHVQHSDNLNGSPHVQSNF